MGLASTLIKDGKKIKKVGEFINSDKVKTTGKKVKETGDKIEKINKTLKKFGL